MRFQLLEIKIESINKNIISVNNNNNNSPGSARSDDQIGNFREKAERTIL